MIARRGIGRAEGRAIRESPLREGTGDHEGRPYEEGEAAYFGLRAWRKYIGVKMPSRPASAMAEAQRSRVFATRTVPRGTARRVSSARSEVVMMKRPIFELRKPARDMPEPTSG